MKKNKIILLSMVSLFALSITAQTHPVTFGIKAGTNLSNLGGDGAEGTDTKFGYNFGITVDYSITDNLFLASGLEFTNKGAKFKSSGSLSSNDNLVYDFKLKQTRTANYLQLPVYVGYKFNISDALKLNFQAGPYFAFGVAGKLKTKLSGNDLGKALVINEVGEYDPEIDTFDDVLKRFDLGLGLGVGIEYGAFNVGLGYDFGLLNVSRTDGDDYDIRTQNTCLTIGYKFLTR